METPYGTACLKQYTSIIFQQNLHFMEYFQSLLYALGQQLSIARIEADEEGYIALSFDAHVMHLQYEEQTDEVTAFIQLGSIEEADHLPDICLMLLAANMFWQGTQGATFSLEPLTKKVFLAERQALSLLNPTLFYDWLERLIDVASYWEQRLARVNVGASTMLESRAINVFSGMRYR